MPGSRMLAAGVAMVAALAIAGCGATGHVEGTFTYPPPRAPTEAPLPETRQPAPPRRESPPPREQRPPRRPKYSAPSGIYFLHGAMAGLEDCTFVGERVAGAEAPLHQPEAERRQRDAMLDLAQDARGLGGNVVVLPSFAADYRSGRLVGRIYRCDEVSRAHVYRHAASAQQLTVLPP